MGGDALSGIEQGVGRAVGVLSAITSIKQGGLANYFMNRGRLLADPAFRATLTGSPFTAGVFGVGGGMAPGPVSDQLVAPAGPSEGVLTVFRSRRADRS